MRDGAPLATAADAGVEVEVAAVVTGNGPGSWTRDVRWDEYRLRVRNEFRR